LLLNKNLSQHAIPLNAKPRPPLMKNCRRIWISTIRIISSQTLALIETFFGLMPVMLKLKLTALVKELDVDKPGP
jgi:hypothetical protein